jgi:hypothetical protein
MLASTQVRNPKFTTSVVAETRAMLAETETCFPIIRVGESIYPAISGISVDPRCHVP